MIEHQQQSFSASISHINLLSEKSSVGISLKKAFDLNTELLPKYTFISYADYGYIKS